jgi:AbrB family looped-hinge helix DNA binding protein
MLRLSVAYISAWGKSMLVHSVKLSKDGRVLIPAVIRANLGLQEGSQLTLRVENGEIRLFDKVQALRKAQALASKFKKSKESVVDEFLNDRRKQTTGE